MEVGEVRILHMEFSESNYIFVLFMKINAYECLRTYLSTDFIEINTHVMALISYHIIFSKCHLLLVSILLSLSAG